MTEFRHKPVLLEETLRLLDVKPDGVYVDGTLGGGGHARAVFSRLETGRLIGIDRDADAIRAQTIQDARFTVLRGNFHDAKNLLAPLGVTALDGALLDLGVSSHQLDERERGFSYHTDAPLDMRMDAAQTLCARDIVNGWPEADIARILRDYGEENWAARIAKVIVDRRPIDTTLALVNAVDAAIPRKMREKDGSHPARRTFQALRIAVNDELDPLAPALKDLADLLKPGGRLCVIAFHSLEDRIVKETFKNLADPCTCPRDFPVCVCGRVPTVRLVTRKPVRAGEEELAENPRARSATLRCVEKLGGIA